MATKDWLSAPISNAPLAVFRMLFGAAMLFSTLRFWLSGWIEDHFVHSALQFKYFGFEWVTLLPPTCMYAVFALMALGATGIMLGAFYRFSTGLFFLTFTYVELVDLTYYLNHYYFVSLIAFLLIWLPANRRFAVDVWRRPGSAAFFAPRWTVVLLQFQVAVVYVFAGLAKVQSDWLVEAMPMRLWLPASGNLPVIGPFLRLWWMPWVFSWAGMLYDLTIAGWLLWGRTRPVAYASVLVFHLLTALLFQIGVFPLVMVLLTWVFFSEDFHEKTLRWLHQIFPFRGNAGRANLAHVVSGKLKPAGAFLLMAYAAFQLLFPLRYLVYPGNLFWTEEGFRFSWRVMLMEKSGTALFYVKDAQTGREGVVDNARFLRNHQERQMATQPDMILQYARFLKKYYSEKGMADPYVRAEVYVTLNGRPSRLLFDPHLDLTALQDSWLPRRWLHPAPLEKDFSLTSMMPTNCLPVQGY